MEDDTPNKYPFLDRLKEDRYTGKIPEGYLDRLAKKQWNSESQPAIEKKEPSLFYITRIAAAFIVMLASYFIIQEINSTSQQTELFTELTEDELIDYVTNNTNDFNVALLSEVYYDYVDDHDLIDEDHESLEIIELEELEHYLLEETL